MAIRLINDFYNLENSKTVAINLVKQEANHILTGIGLNKAYQIDEKKLVTINRYLNELRKHDLSNRSDKNTVNAEESMNESDYDF
ncbi:hypothetical protein [Enterococcus faecium]|uniref:hypothetical protein n=1 Tax=Enterococcus faecium TaxID=1352 RepID=UPI00215855B3|nr:hypothetical protein [Enterococcus faecium]